MTSRRFTSSELRAAYPGSDDGWHSIFKQTNADVQNFLAKVRQYNRPQRGATHLRNGVREKKRKQKEEQDEQGSSADTAIAIFEDVPEPTNKRKSIGSFLDSLREKEGD